VKHPFDVGDRVTVYGNTGTTLKGDDYFVKEISLLYTEFKKMEGHVVQAPNSYLNTLFILNQRRSGGLAEAVPIIWKVVQYPIPVIAYTDESSVWNNFGTDRRCSSEAA